MKKLISVLILIAFLITVAIYEEVFLNNFKNNMKVYSNELSILISNNEDNLNKEEIKKSFNNLEIYWDKAKNTLCFFTNYEKIRTMDESFIKLSEAIEKNDKALAFENSAIIKDCSEFFNYMLGFNINSLF